MYTLYKVLMCALMVASVGTSADAGRGGGRSTAYRSSRSKSSGGAVHVRGYTRKDGTYVRPHTRSAPGSGSHFVGSSSPMKEPRTTYRSQSRTTPRLAEAMSASVDDESDPEINGSNSRPTQKSHDAVPRSQFNAALFELNRGTSWKIVSQLLKSILEKHPNDEAADKANAELEKLQERQVKCENLLESAKNSLKSGQRRDAANQLKQIVIHSRGSSSFAEARQLYYELQREDDRATAEYKALVQAAKNQPIEKIRELVDQFKTKFPDSTAVDAAASLLDKAIEREKDAAKKLDLAKELFRNNRDERARARLEKIIEEHPETDAAREAKSLLKKF